MSLLVLLLIGFFTACTPNQPAQAPSPTPTQTSTPFVASEPATPEITPTASGGPDPSYKVAAFYYPWYGNPAIDGEWIHWTQNNHMPPDDIASDYYPALGAYSSNDPAVVAQHMEWLQTGWRWRDHHFMVGTRLKGGSSRPIASANG